MKLAKHFFRAKLGLINETDEAKKKKQQYENAPKGLKIQRLVELKQQRLKELGGKND